jgi:hypothetical protein
MTKHQVRDYILATSHVSVDYNAIPGATQMAWVNTVLRMNHRRNAALHHYSGLDPHPSSVSLKLTHRSGYLSKMPSCRCAPQYVRHLKFGSRLSLRVRGDRVIPW